MNTEDVRNDVKLVLQSRGIRAHRLAALAGIDKGSLWRFLNEGANINSDTLFRLWAVIYGDQRPAPILAPPKESHETICRECVHCAACAARLTGRAAAVDS